MTDFRRAIDRGVELLTLCQQFQSEKDGIERPPPGVFDRTKTSDQFARDIEESVMFMGSLHRLIPMASGLAALGRKLEGEGKIKVNFGDDYAKAALQFLLAEHGVAEPAV